MRVPERKLIALSDKMSFAEGAMVEPVACAIHAQDVANIASGDVALVIGARSCLPADRVSIMPQAIRITIGEPAENERLVEASKRFWMNRFPAGREEPPAWIGPIHCAVHNKP